MTKFKLWKKAVLFDWDSTIVDTRNTVLLAVNKTLKHFGKPTIKEYTQSGKSLEILRKSIGEQWKDAIPILKLNLREESFDNLKIFPGILDFLYLLKENNIFTGIVSNKHSDLLKKDVISLGISDYFDMVVGSGDTDEDKPSPKPLFYCLSVSGIKPSKKDVIFIGDSILDMQCAQSANVTGIVYGNFTLEGFEGSFTIKDYSSAYQDIFKNKKTV